MNMGDDFVKTHWLETVQTLEAPKAQLWQLLQPTAWEDWWPSVEEVFMVEGTGNWAQGTEKVLAEPGALCSIPSFGSTYQLLWRTPYGYSLATRVQITEQVEGELMELHFCDGLEGFVRFALQDQGEATELGVCWELASREAWISPAEMERTLEALAGAIKD